MSIEGTEAPNYNRTPEMFSEMCVLLGRGVVANTISQLPLKEYGTKIQYPIF